MKLPFEKIYCLHLAEAKDRYTNVLKEIEKINLENEVDFWYTTKKPINLVIGNNINTLHTSFYDKTANINEYAYGAVFDCAYNHYSIIKQAYVRGINSILIFEDDFKFKDIDILNDIVDDIPNDYDVIKFYNHCYNKDNIINDNIYFELLDENNYKPYYRSTLCYALSRNGMKAIIDEYENKFGISDIVLDTLRTNKDIKFYVLKQNVFCTLQSLKSCITEK
jgi:GR25 family glycosyltransferase involved in LPS biosynthesis